MIVDSIRGRAGLTDQRQACEEAAVGPHVLLFLPAGPGDTQILPTLRTSNYGNPRSHSLSIYKKQSNSLYTLLG